MTAISTPTVSSQAALPFADLEQVYEQLAVTLDSVPETQHTPLLAQLALALAHRIPDIDQVIAAINEAREGIQIDEEGS
ncbi:hypothetical protein M0220_09560 [Halomonas qinghailakensis]|uniref:DUF2783 domain-containing protein n=1 Tax=Halomonas qinghailakensis TaxID=2937790 RepID=A0AA46YMQ9_9GAMM|nr:hypothetical protein [Halomonas sp. ZZQ-149]UYO73146.1 hypothetical protein M0220_09560 [Halomonas sp. ZZQ-149]